jgi:hypothetical protein
MTACEGGPFTTGWTLGFAAECPGQRRVPRGLPQGDTNVFTHVSIVPTRVIQGEGPRLRVGAGEEVE